MIRSHHASGKRGIRRDISFVKGLTTKPVVGVGRCTSPEFDGLCDQARRDGHDRHG